MKYLIRNCKITQPGSSWNGKRADILIIKGKISAIGRSLDLGSATEIKGKNLHASIGWMDIGTHLGEPGYEHRETLESLTKAAASGGYTDLVTFPKAIPAIQTKAQIQNLHHSGQDLGVAIHPIAALSHDLQGENITEFIDMHNAGAVGFSDGLKPIDKGGLLLRALQYAKSFDGIIFHHPSDDSLSNGDLIHEGEVSTSLGMKGSPVLAEELTTYRDVQLNSYAESKLAIHLISSKSAAGIIKDGKKKDNNLSAGVAYLNLIRNDQALATFDSNHKVKPILRSEKDQKALIKAVKEGTIDYISSNHVPLEVEKKHLEYPYASHGSIGLETCFAALNTELNKQVDLSIILQKLTTGPREVLGIATPKIAEGEDVCLTVFDPSQEWTYNKADIKSTSENTPFIGATFTGKVMATFNKAHTFINA